MTLHEAYETLGLTRDAGAAQVKAAYRVLVAQVHPDHGGDAADFIRVRAAYEILLTFLREPTFDETDAPVPADLRSVIDALVRDLRDQQQWAEAETGRRLQALERKMAAYISSASRTELRQFSATFRNSWDAVIGALFENCNDRCDTIMEKYESWYTANTQAFFDDLYRKELLRFAWRRRFWEVFLVLGALAGGLSVVVGWTGPVRPWISAAMFVVALALAFMAHRWTARRQRRAREKVEPLSVVPFVLPDGARFQTEAKLRKGRAATGALGVAGMLLGNTVSGGIAVPVAGALAGAALGGAVDRLLNPTSRMRQEMQHDLHRFMAAAEPQMTAYVAEAHRELSSHLRDRIVENYQERVKGTIRLLTAG